MVTGERGSEARKGKPRKGLTDLNFVRSAELLIDDSRWDRVAANLPDKPKLTKAAAAKLRADIGDCCSRFLTRQRRLPLDAASAAVLRRPKAGRRAPFERFVDGLKMAAAAWAMIGRIGRFHGSRLADSDEYGRLESIAQTAAAQLAGLQKLTPIEIIGPFKLLVGEVADAVRAAGFRLPISGRSYDERSPSPSWFQLFVTEIDRSLLGSRRLLHGDPETGKEYPHDPRATYDAIKKAVRAGGRKPGNRRK
jgi:hypothetical protein